MLPGGQAELGGVQVGAGLAKLNVVADFGFRIADLVRLATPEIDYNSFPRSAWERETWPLCGLAWGGATQSVGVVCSHAERGNKKIDTGITSHWESIPACPENFSQPTFAGR